MERGSKPATPGRPERAAASAYVSGVSIETRDHSTSETMSRRAARSTDRWRRWQASATPANFCGMISGIAPPTTRGQKWRGWRRAAAWKVRAWTAGTPRSRRRDRISSAALAVNVTART